MPIYCQNVYQVNRCLLLTYSQVAKQSRQICKYFLLARFQIRVTRQWSRIKPSKIEILSSSNLAPQSPTPNSYGLSYFLIKILICSLRVDLPASPRWQIYAVSTARSSIKRKAFPFQRIAGFSLKIRPGSFTTRCRLNFQKRRIPGPRKLLARLPQKCAPVRRPFRKFQSKIGYRK